MATAGLAAWWRGRRTRTRLLTSFLAIHLALSLAAGVVAWHLIDGYLIRRAEASARRVGEVLAAGGFTVNERNRELMERLTGLPFRLDPPPGDAAPGTVRVVVDGRTIEIAYRDEAWSHASAALRAGIALFTLAGVLAFGLAAWSIARRWSRPLEALAAGARHIGEGDWQEAIPPAGGGEVGDLARDLESMRRRLRDLDEAHRRAERLAVLGTFTATIAHEVRNPLSAVRLTVQLLARKHPGDPGLALITDELERLDLIVDGLLSFARGVTLRPERCDLAAVAADVLRLLRRQAEHAGVTLRQEGATLVQADPSRLRQLLLNLVLNAIQAQHGGGEVLVRIVSDGFDVADRGPGVPPAERERIFEPFRSQRADGVGLGLHIARTIAEAHGASIVCDDNAPGAVFRLRGLKA